MKSCSYNGNYSKRKLDSALKFVATRHCSREQWQFVLTEIPLLSSPPPSPNLQRLLAIEKPNQGLDKQQFDPLAGKQQRYPARWKINFRRVSGRSKSQR